MKFDITKRRASETAVIELEAGDGSPLFDDKDKVLTVTIFGPGTKEWQRADAEKSRKRTKRIEKNRGKLSVALEGGKEDEVDFLVSITKSFDGWEYPHSEKDGEWKSQADMFRAAYEDESIGYIRDQVHGAGTTWEAFTKG